MNVNYKNAYLITATDIIEETVNGFQETLNWLSIFRVGIQSFIDLFKLSAESELGGTFSHNIAIVRIVYRLVTVAPILKHLVCFH